MPAAVDLEAAPQGVQRAFLIHHFLDGLSRLRVACALSPINSQ